MNTAHLTQIQIACMTKFTREGVRDMTNRKPYRTKAQKAVARSTAFIAKGGHWASDAPVSFHK